MIVIGAIAVLLFALLTAIVAGMGESVDEIVAVGWISLGAGLVVVGMVSLIGFW